VLSRAPPRPPTGGEPPAGAGAGAAAASSRSQPRTPSLAPPRRDFAAELAELEAAFGEIFACLRFEHMTRAQLGAVAADGEVGAVTIADARRSQARAAAKLALASNFNVRRLTELDSLSPRSAAFAHAYRPAADEGGEVGGASGEGEGEAEVEAEGEGKGGDEGGDESGGGASGEGTGGTADAASSDAGVGTGSGAGSESVSGVGAGLAVGSGCATPRADVRDARWPPFRFGLELGDVFSEEMSPGAEGDPRQKSSERVAYAGSLWCLDVKRYNNAEEGQEFVAVYLRRRALAAPPPPMAEGSGGGAPVVEGAPAPEDTRERTTMGFSIRLCGAPGAPTSNSVCGRSVAGKAFGTVEEQSWGWESVSRQARAARARTRSSNRKRRHPGTPAPRPAQFVRCVEGDDGNAAAGAREREGGSEGERRAESKRPTGPPDDLISPCHAAPDEARAPLSLLSGPRARTAARSAPQPLQSHGAAVELGRPAALRRHARDALSVSGGVLRRAARVASRGGGRQRPRAAGSVSNVPCAVLRAEPVFAPKVRARPKRYCRCHPRHPSAAPARCAPAAATAAEPGCCASHCKPTAASCVPRPRTASTAWPMAAAPRSLAAACSDATRASITPS
jgi:hypothetical protein